jgi:hypothetical protein
MLCNRRLFGMLIQNQDLKSVFRIRLYNLLDNWVTHVISMQENMQIAWENHVDIYQGHLFGLWN